MHSAQKLSASDAAAAARLALMVSDTMHAARAYGAAAAWSRTAFHLAAIAARSARRASPAR
jgi:hypothetical protein